MNKPAPQRATDADAREPSLAPACGFFFLLFAVMVSVGLIGIAWWLGRNQHELAEKAIHEQLIPWIDDSSLSNNDRRQIVASLQELAQDIRAQQVDEKQLARLKFVLSANPLFQWGAIDALQAHAASLPDLTEAERRGLKDETQRLMRTVVQGRLGMDQLEFALQPVVSKEASTGRLSLIETAKASDVREYTRRAAGINDRAKPDDLPNPATVAEALDVMIDMARRGPPARP